ncbi:hypothetical protein MHYP_G00056290 [Metynnis hypsauchen]
MKRRGTADIAASRLCREPAGESVIWYSNLLFRDLLRQELLCKHTLNRLKKARALLERIQKSPCGPLLILFAERWDVLFQILAVLSQHAHKRQTQRDNRDIPPPNVNTGGGKSSPAARILFPYGYHGYHRYGNWCWLPFPGAQYILPNTEKAHREDTVPCLCVCM